MASAVEADLAQLGVILSIYKRLSPVVDPSEIAEEIVEHRTGEPVGATA